MLKDVIKKIPDVLIITVFWLGGFSSANAQSDMLSPLNPAGPGNLTSPMNPLNSMNPMNPMNPTNPMNQVEPMNSIYDDHRRSFIDDPSDPMNIHHRSSFIDDPSDPMNIHHRSSFIDDPSDPMNIHHRSSFMDDSMDPTNPMRLTSPMNPLNSMNSTNSTNPADPMNTAFRNQQRSWEPEDYTSQTIQEDTESMPAPLDTSVEKFNKKNYLNFNIGSFGFIGLEYTRDISNSFSISGGASFAPMLKEIDEIFTFPVSLRYNFLREHHRPYFCLGAMPTIYRISNFWEVKTDIMASRLYPTNGTSDFPDKNPLVFTTLPFARLGYEYETSRGIVMGLGASAIVSTTLYNIVVIPGVNFGSSF